jgi:trigger factor
MQIEELEKKDLAIKYKVTISKNEFEQKIEDKAQDLSKTAKLDGFRVGKVPISVIKLRYKHPLQTETIEFFMESASKDLVKSKSLVLSSSPEVHDVHFHEGKDLTFNIEVELLPEIPAIDMKKIKLERKVVEVSDEEISKGIEKLRSDFKEFKTLGDKHPAKDGEAVLIDATGFMDGKEFSEGKVTDKHLVIGSNEFIAGFESGLIGSKVGESKLLNLSFPSDYWKNEMAGKPVSFDVVVKDVCEVVLPDDENLAKKLGLKDAVELKAKISEFIGSRYNTSSLDLLKKELFDYLDDNVDFPVPQKLLKKELKFLASDEENKEQEEKNSFVARRRVKMGLILSSFAKDKNIKITQEDVNKEIMQHLSSVPAQQHQFIVDYYRNNPQALEHVRGKVLEDKAIDELLKTLVISEKKVTAEELNNLFDKIS